jgi:aspartyl-tRNA synthetase
MHPYRTHTCGELKKSDVGQKVRLSGWIHNRRDHGGVLFIDLRDHYGLSQIVVHPETGFQDELSHTRKETVVRFDGEVIPRDPENVNPKLPTGEVEIKATAFEILGTCEELPFSVFPDEQIPDDLRLKYRFLDLRRESVHANIMLRNKVVSFLRRIMTDKGFNEIQTPILTSSSPEGARDYLVPSRVHPGKFYALPQAPQQFKQLLMIAGFDRYFQIAPCFRDEDSRADRSPGEFYQLDIEMSFASQEDVFSALEDVLTKTFREFSKKTIPEVPFPRIPYREAMLKYGSDKPDLRIPIEIRDMTEAFRSSAVKVFNTVIGSGGVLRIIPVKAAADKPRSFFDKTVEFAQSVGAKGLAYLTWEKGEVKGPIAKFMKPEEFKAIEQACSIGEGDAVFFVCDKEANAVRIGREVRLRVGQELDLIEKDVFRFCWIVDFPMFEYDEELKKVVFSHNPFSMPQGGMEALEKKDPLDILAYQYDIVCNGIELSSGAIRNHRQDVMFKAFSIAGYSEDEVKNKFPALMNAFRFGAPPHGGIAPGVDRMVMLLADAENIREIIAFPMNQTAQDLLMNAPNTVSDKQLRDLHIRVVEDEPAPKK